jgi:PAS domain S-box-containing protein/diguanylate cyclase (GGDEF)-like protein
VEDDERDSELVLRQLKRAGVSCESRRVQTEPELRRSLLEFGPHIVLSDFAMPGFNGMDALRICRELDDDIPFIFMSGTVGEDVAVDAVKAGANDYVMKTNLARLGPVVQRELREAVMRKRMEHAVHRAEQAGRESEARLQTIFEAAAVGIVHSDLDGRVLMVNPKFAEITGYARDEVTKLGLGDLTHPADLQKSLKSRARLLAGTTGQYEREARLIRKDGKEVWTSITTSPILADEGKPSHFISIIRDISERRRMEQELHRFRLALDNSADMVIIIDRATMRMVDVNQTACKLLGYTREELLRMGPQDTLPASREELAKKYDELIANPSLPSGIESYYRCKDGSHLPFESTRHVLRSGDTWLIAAVSRDIRQRLASERARRESESLKGAILASSLDALVTIDHHGNIVEFNPAAEATFGFTRGQALGKPLAELVIPPRHRDAHSRGFARYLATGEGPVLGKRIEIEAMRADGTEFPVELTITPIHSGSTPLFTGFIRDITQRRAAETRIKRLNRVYAVLSGINSLIVRVQNREDLYRGACRIAVEAGQFPKAWIGEVEPGSKSVSLIATHGADAPFFERLAAALRTDIAQGGIVAQAVKERRAVISNDIEHDPRVLGRDVAVATGSRAIAVLPLTVGNGIAGVLVLHAEATDFFDDDEMKLLLELSEDISFALDHIDQEERVKRLTRVHAVLTGINAAIVRIRDRQELFREACRIAVEAAQLRLAWIGIVDPRKEEILPAAFSGPEEGFLGIIRLSTKEDSGRFGMAGRAVRDRTPAVSNDVLADERTRFRDESEQRGFRALAMIPLIVDGAVFGVLGLHAPEAGFFDQDEMKLLMEVAGNLAFALEHIAKEEKVRRLTRVQAVLSGINAAIVRIRDRQELFQEACRIAVDSGEFRMAWVGIVDREEGIVKPVASAGAVGDFFDAAPLTVTENKPGGHGLAGRAIRTMKPVISNDVHSDPQRLMKRELDERDIQSVAIIPLIVGEEAVGVLALYAAEVGAFNDEEMRLLLELAGDVAFALEHIGKAEKVDYLSYYDSLTGLANRTLFHERLEQSILNAAGERRTLGLALFDIERFKAINDSLGRQAGDALLKQIAERMMHHAASAARTARIGGDQFAKLVPDMQADEFARFIEKHLGEVYGEPFRVNDTELQISARVGIAIYPDNGADADTLFRNAEAALKKAKAGGERYLFYTETMNERVAEKLSLENKLRQALEKDEFVLHYQPKVELENRKIVGVEALIRWQSPELGLVPPMKFIPLLEETGLILQVGSWALRRAAFDHRGWVEQRLKPPRVAVNVSPIQLRQRDFVRIVEQAIMEGVAPVGIDLEITESLIMEDIQTNIEKLLSVRKLGIQVAIDDFGTGYSSLSYLARLPVETLKIDRSFVITMLEDPNTATLVQTMISLAHSFRLKVVAEGVDSEEQAKMLRLLRCDQMQGYLFSKPVPNDALVALLRKSS